jgi:hypothetical protein
MHDGRARGKAIAYWRHPSCGQRRLGAVLSIVLVLVGGGTVLVALTSDSESTVAGDRLPSAANICPIGEEACIFAAQIDRWLAATDVAAVVRRIQPEQVECRTLEENQRRNLEQVCAGAAVGDRRAAYRWGERFLTGGIGVGFRLTDQEYQDALRLLLSFADASVSDAYGSGALRLYGFECIDAKPPRTCATAYAVTFTYMDSELRGQPVRVFLQFIVEQPPTVRNPRITMTIGLAPERSKDDISPTIARLIPWTP